MVKPVTTNDSGQRRMTTSGTPSDNDWYSEWQWMSTSDNEQRRVVPFFQKRKGPTTMQPKENPLNLGEDLEGVLLN